MNKKDKEDAKTKKEAEEYAKLEREEKDPSVKAANDKAAQTRNNEELQKLIVKEGMRLTDGEINSVQQLMAYCRCLKKYEKK